MSDPNLFLVDVEILKKKYRHLGILGRGKDPFLEIYSTINIVEDTFTQQRRAIQVFQNLSQEIYTRKLDQLYKSAYMFYVSFHLPILAFSYKKNEDKTYDVYVLYEFEKMSLTLEDKIQEKKSNKAAFTQEELWNVTFMLIDSMYMGSRLSIEYLDINPYNIYFVPDEPQQYFITNFGLQYHKKFEKRLYCPSDRFYNSQSKPGDRPFEQYISSYMFQVGMISLYMASLSDPNELYNDIFGLETKTLNQEKLKSRLESIKQKVSEKYFAFLTALLQVKEEKRINIEELMNTNEGQNMFERQRYYYQGELADAKMYSGFVTRVQDQDQVPHGIGDIFTDSDQYYKGSFQNGSIHGYGIWFDGTSKYAHGRWENDELKQGFLIQKNQYIFYGHISDFNPGGVGVLFSLSCNSSSDYLYFNGQFNEKGIPTEGQTLFKDGRLEDTPPKTLIDYCTKQANQEVNEQQEQQ